MTSKRRGDGILQATYDTTEISALLRYVQRNGYSTHHTINQPASLNHGCCELVITVEIVRAPNSGRRSGAHVMPSYLVVKSCVDCSERWLCAALINHGVDCSVAESRIPSHYWRNCHLPPPPSWHYRNITNYNVWHLLKENVYVCLS
jgi:hypothetical protein